MAVRWQVYPTSQRPPQLIRDIAAVFEAQSETVGTPPNRVDSDTVLKAVAPGLRSLGFKVEASKSDKISVPLHYGVNGKPGKTYSVDAWHPDHGAVIEVEAGSAVDARKLYQDLFEAIAMPDVRFLCIAVQNAYHPERRKEAFDDFERGKKILDGLFASGRMVLPIEAIALLGY